MSNNKRSKKRLGYNDRILCYKHINTRNNVIPDPSPIQIEITNISYSGLGILCNRDLNQGDFLFFNLESNKITKEFMLEVKWCKYVGGHFEAGLAFTGLTRDRVIFLDTLIKSFLKKQML